MKQIKNAELWYEITNMEPADKSCGIPTEEIDYTVTLTVDGIEVRLTTDQIESLRLEEIILGAIYDRRKGNYSEMDFKRRLS